MPSSFKYTVLDIETDEIPVTKIHCICCMDFETGETKEFIDEELMEDVYGAYSIMSMNAIYYRFTHLSSEDDYFNMPANLRMQYLSKFKIDKSDFEMLCLAVAIIIGCGKCINAHENILRENNISKLHIQTVARIASIVNSIANVIRVLN